MPTYTLKDTNTEETWDVICSWNELQEILKSRPELKQQLSTPAFSGSGTKDNVSKAGSNWRDLLGKIKKGSGKDNTIKV